MKSHLSIQGHVPQQTNQHPGLRNSLHCNTKTFIVRTEEAGFAQTTEMWLQLTYQISVFITGLTRLFPLVFLT